MFLDLPTWSLAVRTKFGRIAMTSEVLNFCMKDDLTESHLVFFGSK